jgi:CheY-like chemotaxis protein
MQGHPPILVVEDNENDVTLIRRTLTRARIPNPLRLVGSGEEAIAYLVRAATYSDRENYPFPALVLLDLKLPGIDGFAVLQWIRQQRHFMNDLRVVVLTSSHSLRDVKKVYRLGANSFLVKPLEFQNIHEIFATLQWHLTETTAMPVQPPSTVGVK